MRKLLILILIFFILAASGCSEQATSTDQEPITGLDYGTVKVIREDVGPQQGGTLNLFMLTPDTLNPLKTENRYVRQFSTFVFDPLFHETDAELENIIAHDFSFSQDGLVMDIQLKDNIYFHDGESLSSEDVVFTIEEIKKAGKKSLYFDHLVNIECVKAVNRLNIRIILNKKDMRLAHKLTFPIVPSHVFKDWPIEGHSDQLKVVGTGPFIFKSYSDDVIELTRNDSWWRLKTGDINHPIWLDGIIFKVYSNESDMMQAFQRREIDVAFIEEGYLDSYSRRSDIFFSKYESNVLEFLTLSAVGSTGSPMGQENFRTILLNYLSWYAVENPIKNEENFRAIDTTLFVEEAANRAETLQALSVAGFNYKEDKNILVYFKNGVETEVRLRLYYNNLNQERQETAKWVSQALFELGIEVILTGADYSEQQAYIKTGKFDMMLLGCRIPLYTDMGEAIELLKKGINMDGENAVILPIYRKYGAVLYHNHIRGPRNPVWRDIYNQWHQWYLVVPQE